MARTNSARKKPAEAEAVTVDSIATAEVAVAPQVVSTPKPVGTPKSASKPAAAIKAAAAPEPAPAQIRRGRVFAVTRTWGSAWDSSRSLEQQEGWTDHAAYMNALEAEGFVALGGPLEDTPYVFLAVRAENEMEARSRFASDPWEMSRMLETTRIAGWTMALGAGKI